jgi:hypothetical protein
MDAVLERLAESGAQVLLEAIVVGLMTGVAAAMARSLVRRGKVWIGHGAGRTCMSPYVLLVGLLCAVAAAGFAIVGLAHRESLGEPRQLYAWMGLVGAFSLCALAILPFTRHTWEWDAHGLRWQGAWRGVRLRWPDLVRLGKSMSGQLYVVDVAGREISWSQHTLEHEALMHAVQTARPDLVLPGPAAVESNPRRPGKNR